LQWVPETAFGKWFLSTGIWFKYVLSHAVADLKQLAGEPAQNPARLLDAGCGWGLTFPLLAEAFKPESIIGIDVEPRQLARAAEEGRRCPCPVTVQRNSVTQLDLADGSIDVVFMHQLIHHVADQAGALRELYRVMRPGGVLMVGESCEVFIQTWSVRYFFRHPDGVQHSARGYVEMIRAAGFTVDESQVKTSTPFWSLPDYGLLRRLGLSRGPEQPSEVLIVARKPQAPPA
jgi:ubiquinone/menaquinone biosynthesis C-methylase UbiE